MKRLIASRKLARRCIYCERTFNKGEVYYKQRTVIGDESIYAYEHLVCPKCKHRMEQQGKRFENFKERCIHPSEFITTKYSYIQGEAVQEPSYNYCQLCGKIV